MKPRIHNIVKEPAGDVYFELLDAALLECRFALLVVRDQISLSEEGMNLLNLLLVKLVAENRASEWPGTRLLTSEARILTYEFTPKTLEILKESSSRLYEWMQPSLPEDLCLLRSDHSLWIVSIAHEKDGYLSLTGPEMQTLLEAYPGLRDLVAI